MLNGKRKIPLRMAGCFKKPVFLLLLACSLLSFQSDRNMLLWQEGKPLTWDDFMGKPEKRFAAASTHYDIIKKIVRDDKKVTVMIEAVFLRNSSWKKLSWINDEVLAHEQKHFDVVELYSRKLRKLIAEAGYRDYSDLQAKVDGFYGRIDKEMDKYQDQYDEETDGSMNGDKQREWNKKIVMELESMKTFSNQSVHINLP
jgi:hypothetical protein